MVVTNGCSGFAWCIRFIRCSDKNSTSWAAGKVCLRTACISSIVMGARLRFLNTFTAVQDRTDLSRGLLKTRVLERLQRVIWVEVSRLKSRCLSKSYQSQGELFGNWDQGWRAHGIINPLHQFAIGKHVQPQHRGQIGQ